MKRSIRHWRCTSLASNSTVVALLLPLASLSIAQDLGPLDPNAQVSPTRYESPLKDFRAFEPDEPIQSWVDANKRVEEIGGWRAYLRQANPPKRTTKPVSPPKEVASPTVPAPAPVPTAAPSDLVKKAAAETMQRPVPRETQDSESKPVEKQATAPSAASIDATSAEGGDAAQANEMALPIPSVPERFKRGDCPRVLTGLRIPFTGRQTGLSDDVKTLLLKVKRCFGTRDYVIGGHTDNRGPRSANLVLSQVRADAIVEFLSANGVDTERLTAKGFGEARPIDSNRKKRGRARNRRVDFNIDRKRKL